MIKRIDIFGSSGIPMRVVYIPAKIQRPNFPDTLEPYKEDSIAFYDARHQQTPDGQFISDYYVSTLCEGDARNNGVNLYGGIHEWRVSVNLYGGIPEWRVSAKTIQLVLDWVRYISNISKE